MQLRLETCNNDFNLLQIVEYIKKTLNREHPAPKTKITNVNISDAAFTKE
jgi:hypothetical protein